MTPEERAKRIWADYCITANPALLRVAIASAIREAEAEERERAWRIAMTTCQVWRDGVSMEGKAENDASWTTARLIAEKIGNTPEPAKARGET